MYIICHLHMRKLPNTLCSSKWLAGPSGWPRFKVETLTNSMEQSPSWEPNTPSAIQKISRTLWNSKVSTALKRGRHLFLSWARSIPPCPPSHFIHFNIILASTFLSLSSCLLPSCFLTKILYAPLLFPIRAKCPVHLILDVITLVISRE